jgi:hypothetical protein
MAKEKLMKKAVLCVVLLSVMIPAYTFAQEHGSFVGAVGLGLTSAQGDFASSDFFSAGSGFGMEGELRYYLINGFAIGAMANYVRFGSTLTSSTGRVSYNFNQIGGLARLNLMSVTTGKLFVTGGGGVFTPNTHVYIPDNSVDYAADKSGTYFTGGLGLVSASNLKVMYELEVKYSVGRSDDITLPNGNTSNVWDFIYAGFKISFGSKGKDAPPKY